MRTKRDAVIIRRVFHGRKIWEWLVPEFNLGGYCATKEAAITDASICLSQELGKAAFWKMSLKEMKQDEAAANAEAKIVRLESILAELWPA